jgi:prolyl oligopeptidase
MKNRQRLVNLLRLLLFIFCTQLLSSIALAQSAPPTAPVRAVSDDYYGTKVADPYRWMENTADPEFIAWMKAQNDYTRSVLDRIPGRQKLLARITELDNAGVQITGGQRVGNRYFYFKLMPGEDNRKLYVRDGLNGEERLLVDPTRLTESGKHYSIDYFSPSLDGKYVAYGISPGGSENSVMRVVETATARDMGESIDRAQFGGPSWLSDGQSFLYNRLQKLDPGTPQIQKYLKSRVYLHKLGANPDEDKVAFGYNVSPQVQIAETDIPFVLVSPVSNYVLGIVAHGVQNEATIYAAPLSPINGANIVWRKIIDVPDAVTNADVRGDELYVLSHKGASRFKVLRMNLTKPDTATTEVIVPASEAVITGLTVAKDALYVQQLDGGIGRLLRVPYNGKPEQVALPFDGTILALIADPREPGVLLPITSWTKSPRLYIYDQKTKQLVDTKVIPPSPVDFSQIESSEVKAPSADGTLVPLSIIYKRGLARDGANPTLLMGYGAYGITINPAFSPTALAWLERGGVLAFAHVRGGGEYGEDWHQAGYKMTKMNTVKDFIACAEYLIKEKYTSPAHLAGSGTSAGGITIGGAITQRPDLFGAALDRVGVSDNLRVELTPNGPPNIPEFGSVKTEEGFKGLYAMSAYHHIKDGAKYPAVLLTTGINDPRVDPWQMAKMAARLQAATTSGKPILLRVDYDAGHGLGSTKSQRDAQLADEYSFLLWQLGAPDFQPSSQASR